MLCVLDRRSRLIDTLVGLVFLGVEAELDLVDAVAEAEDREVCTFDCGDSFTKLAIFLLSLIVCGDRNELSELLSCFEVFKSNSFIHLMVESDLVQGLFQFPAAQTIVDEGLFGQEMQVLLKRLANKVAVEATEDGFLLGLALQQG